MMGEIEIRPFPIAAERQYMESIRDMVGRFLSESYSIYVYRYFIYQWPHLCYLVSI